MAPQPLQRSLRAGGRPAGRLEAILRRQGYRLVAGCDEVGRGALAGPLVAAAVLFDVDSMPEDLRDSKVLTPAQREELADRVLARAVAASFVVVAPEDIDEGGLQASNLAALVQAVRRLRPAPEFVISDGFPLQGLGVPHVGLPKADALSAAVAGASIVAKVKRDQLMRGLEALYPGYGFASHKGYACAQHWAAIRALGPSPVHRRSFRGVACWQPELVR